MAKSAKEIRREKLIERQRDSVQTRDQKGSGKKSLLDWSKLKVKKPQEFQAEAKKKHLIDLIPFKVTQSWYKDLLTPAGKQINRDIGDLDYKLEISVHKYIGENNETFLCLRESLGRKCPICDLMFEEYAKDNPDKDKATSLNTSWRNYYNIYDYDDEDAEFQVWEDVSWHNYEKEFMDESEDGEEIIIYSDYEFGKSIAFKGKQDSIGKNKFVIPKNISFCDRDPYTEEEIEDAISFDALLHIPTPGEMIVALNGEQEYEESEEKDDKEEKPKSRRGRGKKKEEKPEPKDDNECPEGLEFGYDCDPNGKKCEKCDDDLFERCADAKEDNDKKEPDLKDDNEEKEEKPKSRGRRSKKDDDEKDDDEKDDDAPAVTRKRRK